MDTEAHNRDQRNPEDGQDTLPKPLVYQIRKVKKDMEKFLNLCDLPKLNQEQMHNPSRSIVRNKLTAIKSTWPKWIHRRFLENL